jgi:hypothetical protein
MCDGIKSFIGGVMKEARTISGQTTQLDKANWLRRFDKIQGHITEVNRLSDQIMEIEKAKLPILDQIAELRKELVADCIHPKDYLVKVDGIVGCTFCDRRFTTV